MADNVVTVVGTATRDPELRFTNNGAAVAGFGLAVNRRWKNNQTEEWEEAVTFLDVSCWREMAENVAESISKGTRVFVTGRLEQQEWEDKDTGQKRSKVQIVADEIGPSLRWATAEVVKNERKGGNESYAGASNGSKASHKSEPVPEPF